MGVVVDAGGTPAAYLSTVSEKTDRVELRLHSRPLPEATIVEFHPRVARPVFCAYVSRVREDRRAFYRYHVDLDNIEHTILEHTILEHANLSTTRAGQHRPTAATAGTNDRLGRNPLRN